MIELPAKFAGRTALSPAEAAETLGISVPTFYRRIMPRVYAGRIASIKVGSARRIIITSFLAYIESEVANGT